jgi:putative transposase
VITPRVKGAFKYRFYPTDVQAAELSRTFGCVRAENTASGFRFREGQLTLAKMTGPLNIVWSRPLPPGAKPSTVTVSQDSAGRWFVSLLCQDPDVQPLPVNGNTVGVDAGLEHLLTLSTGEKVTNPRHERRDRKRLARAIADAAWSEFRHMLEYKAGWYGREVIVADRWFPSSKLCSVCGNVAGKLPLDVRMWTCGCGATHDRDVNAAKNLLAAGLAVSACGAGVRPQRGSSRSGLSALKQEALQREP